MWTKGSKFGNKVKDEKKIMLPDNREVGGGQGEEK